MKDLFIIDRFDVFIRFFLYILIFWLPYSPAVVESCVIISLILWAIKRGSLLIKQGIPSGTSKEKLFWLLKGFKPASTFLNKPISFFLLACVLSVAGSVFFAQSLHNFFTKTLEWFVVFFLIVEVFKKKRYLNIALGIFLFTAFSSSLDALVQVYITHKDIFNGRVIDPDGRATAGFKTANGLGGYLTGFIPMVLVWVCLNKQRRPYYFLVGLLVLFVAIWGLVLSFSRGAWIGVFFGGAFFLSIVLFSEPTLRPRFFNKLSLVICVISIALVFVLLKKFGQDILFRSETVRWRLEVWAISFDLIKDRPFFGHGINTFMRLFQAYRGGFANPTYAHNCYIQLAVETGIIGLSCFLWIMARMFVEVFQKIKDGFLSVGNNTWVLTIGLASGIFAFLVHSFFDTQFYSLQISVHLWVLAGMMVAFLNISGLAKPSEVGSSF